jgi:hypothetical protein
MVPPIWLDEQGHRRPVRACLRCGRQAPIYRFRIEHLKLIGWRLFTVVSYTNWCGHAQEFIALPERGGWCRLVPVVGEAAQLYIASVPRSRIPRYTQLHVLGIIRLGRLNGHPLRAR